MASFLEQAGAMGAFKPDSEHKILAAVCERYFGSPATVNIEDLATFLLTDLDSDPFKEREQRTLAYHELTSLIRKTLESIYAKPRSRGTRNVFRDFARFVVGNGVCVLTFNYDLLFDQLLRDTNEWFPFDGYGVRMPLATDGSPANRTWAYEQEGRASKHYFTSRSRMAFLKLHGSLNWGIPYRSRRDTRNEVVLADEGAFPGPRSNTIHSIEDSCVAVRIGERNLVDHFWRPFIVPPGLGIELGSAASEFLSDVWHVATGVLRSSSEVHILGYSLPASDFEADTLIREGLYGTLARRRRNELSWST
jgi:hypothetical protein